MRYFKKDTTLYASELPPRNMDGVIEINEIEYLALFPIPEEDIVKEEELATEEDFLEALAELGVE